MAVRQDGQDGHCHRAVAQLGNEAVPVLPDRGLHGVGLQAGGGPARRDFDGVRRESGCDRRAARICSVPGSAVPWPSSPGLPLPGPWPSEVGGLAVAAADGIPGRGGGPAPGGDVRSAAPAGAPPLPPAAAEQRCRCRKQQVMRSRTAQPPLTGAPVLSGSLHPAILPWGRHGRDRRPQAAASFDSPVSASKSCSSSSGPASSAISIVRAASTPRSASFVGVVLPSGRLGGGASWPGSGPLPAVRVKLARSPHQVVADGLGVDFCHVIERGRPFPSCAS